jgi:hypothetical protein
MARKVSGTEASILIDDERLLQVLELVRGADSVELNLYVPDSERRATARSLGLDPIEAELRQIVFFDTPELALNTRGMVVRARRIQGGKGDTVVKLRPVDPDRLSPNLRKRQDFGVEVDAMPGGFVCSASMKSRAKARDIARVMAGDVPIKSLFSKQQRALYKEHAPDDLKLNDLTPLGPILALKLRSHPKGLGRKLVTELWLYPDGSRIFELSTKCLPAEAIRVAVDLRLFLKSRDVESTDVQQTKTKTALEYFSSLLLAAQEAEDEAATNDPKEEQS